MNLNRREFIGTTAAAALPAQAARPRPNVIFILADDLGIGDVGCYGQEKIQTPNIDRIAAEGIRFTQAYSGHTICAPSRCTLMTGYHSGHGRVRSNRSPQTPLREEDTTVAQLFRKAGYATGAFGKWALGDYGTTGDPNRKGFDEWFGYVDQVHAHNYYTEYLFKNSEKVTLKGNLNKGRKEYSHDLIAAQALNFVERHKSKPFFLYVPFTIPHATLEVPDLGIYASKNWSEREKTYAAMITRMDLDIGRLMKLLDSLRIANNTMVFFSSDNGPAGIAAENRDFFRSKGPLRGMKRDVYEGGIRAPLVARWPGRIKPGQVSEHVCAFWDFLPTAAELCGFRAPNGIDGISIAPALLGKPQKSHEYLYWEWKQKDFKQAVRISDWKGVRIGLKSPIELYDLKNDPGETNDLARKHPDLVERVATIMKTAHTDNPEFPIS